MTLEDIENATVLPELDARDLRRSAIIDDAYQGRRVLVVETRLNPPIRKYRIQIQVRNALYKNAMEFIDLISELDRRSFLQVVTKRIKDLDSFEGGVPKAVQLTDNFSHRGYSMRDAHFPHAFLIYAVSKQALSNKLVAEALSPDLDLDINVGLLVRRSDKCYSEQTICFKHELYMELMM